MSIDETRNRIIESSIELFNTDGCKGVTMDQIAVQMHISKRTLYETFANKEDLIFSCLTEVHRRIGQERLDIYTKAHDPLLLSIYLIKSSFINNNRYAKLLNDAERYYPELNDKILKVFGDKFSTIMRNVLTNAAEKGDLHSTVDIDNAVKMISLSMKRLYNSELANKPDVQSAIKDSIFFYLRGMLSIEALQRYDNREEEFRNLLLQNEN